MSKILNLSNDIKINKNNLQPTYTLLKKHTWSSETQISFTLTSGSEDGGALILLENNYSGTYACVVGTHEGNLAKIAWLGSNSLTVEKNGNTLTFTVVPWASAILIDFQNNTWS